jgi:hypothetical protein
LGSTRRKGSLDVTGSSAHRHSEPDDLERTDLKISLARIPLLISSALSAHTAQ